MRVLQNCQRALFCVFLAMLAPVILQAQNQPVSGVVTSDDGGPIPGAYVMIKGTTTGTATDADGKFTIDAPADATLVFSFIGMRSEEVAVSGRTKVDVMLATDITQLDAVVVVGYGTQKKSDLTGSVASVPMSDLKNVPVMRADQMLQGRVSGVQITQTNAEPGGNVSIRIRGTNSINSGNEPLFVVDGFPGAGDLNTINPSDIESIDVLKDASATAIYGSRGANGVIIITTKKGKADQNNIQFEAYTGVQSVRHKYDMMNGTEFAKYLNDVTTLNNQENGTTTALPFTQDQINGIGKGTDWQDEIFRTAPMRNYQLSFNGGTTATRYNLSMNYFDQEGIVINSGYKRGSIRFNLDRKISDKINFQFTSQLTRSKENHALVNTAGGSAAGVVMDALRISPTVSVNNADGSFYTGENQPKGYVDPQPGNPVAYARQAYDHRNIVRGLLNAAAEYEIIKGLKFRVSGGVDLSYGNNDAYVPSGLWFGGVTTKGSANLGTNNKTSWVNENTLTFDKTINEIHALNIVAGFSAQQFTTITTGASSTQFFTDQLGANNIGLGDLQGKPSSGKSVNSLASYFARANYRLKERYLFTVTMRADGSSRFGPDNKWGYFPSAAFGWRIIEEDFMSDVPLFSDLKFRASYGITGNQEIGSYQSQTRYQQFAAHNQRTNYVAGTTTLTGLTRANIPNKDLSWESTESVDFGIDAGFFENRLTLTVDYYDKTTRDLLLNAAVPQTTGYSSILLNAGKVGNKGIEIAVSTINVDQGKFKWSTTLNFSRNRNKVLDLNGEAQRFVGTSSTSLFSGSSVPTSVLRVGQPIGSFYGYKFEGIWQTPEEIAASGITAPNYKPGDPRYANLKADNTINGDDRTIIGKAQPDFIYGMTNNVSFGRFNFMVLLQGVQGVNVLNLNRYELESGYINTNKMRDVITDSWTGPGTSNKLPKVNSTVRRSTGVTSDLVENASFMRVKTVTLGYSIPVPSSINKVVRGANIYVTAQNLLTITKYTGFDPEVNSFGGDNLSLNTDYNAFPSAKTFIFGIKLDL